MAISPKVTPWVLRRIWTLIDKKHDADLIDDSHSMPIQDLEEFVIESYLIRSEKRSDAELSIYTLCLSMQETYNKHPMIHTFARFFGILDGYTVEQMKKFSEEKEAAAEMEREKKKKAKYKKMTSRERTTHAREEAEEEPVGNPGCFTALIFAFGFCSLFNESSFKNSTALSVAASTSSKSLTNDLTKFSIISSFDLSSSA